MEKITKEELREIIADTFKSANIQNSGRYINRNTVVDMISHAVAQTEQKILAKAEKSRNIDDETITISEAAEVFDELFDMLIAQNRAAKKKDRRVKTAERLKAAAELLDDITYDIADTVMLLDYIVDGDTTE